MSKTFSNPSMSTGGFGLVLEMPGCHLPTSQAQIHFGVIQDSKCRQFPQSFKKCIIKIHLFFFCKYRGKKAQPDNFEGLAAGKLVKVSDPVGLTLEGLQEWHDEA